MVQVGIVDYGMGNLGSVRNAFEYLGAKTTLVSDSDSLKVADILVLPGVGAFGQAMQHLRSMEILDALNEQVCERKKPFLGICLGMQLLAESSSEHGFHKGFGWIPGRVCRIERETLRVPHVGWNELNIRPGDPLYAGFQKPVSVYFVHSYWFESSDPASVKAFTDYGGPITASIQKDNIYGLQYHPEKSHKTGLHILKNFLNLSKQH